MTFPRSLPIIPALVLVTAISAGAAEDGLIDSPMYGLPALDGPKTIIEYRGEKDLWLKALSRPEAEWKCRAAETIADALGKGVQGLETTVDPLLRAFTQKDAHPAVRLATARTLIRLDAQAAAEPFLDAVKTASTELRELVEPALAKWDHRPARSIWLERLKDPRSPPRERLLAMRLLAVVNEKEAVAPLLHFVPATVPEPTCRLDAALALGSLQKEGFEEPAGTLLANKTPRGIIDRLVAVRLIRNHRGEGAVQLLQATLRDEEPAVALLAAESLFANDPRLLVGSLDLLLSHRDPGVRRVGVEVIRRLPDPERIDRLIGRLGDDHVDVRTAARKALFELAKDATLKERMLTGATKMLAASDWKVLEQATILLTQLDHKPAAKQFLGLLKQPRSEAFMSAAWGLRKLDVPETLPGVLQFIDSRLALYEKSANARPFEEWDDHQLSQLNQFLGQRRFSPADRSMHRFLNLSPQFREARCAAAWALGMIHEGKPVGERSEKFEEIIRAAKAQPATDDLNVARMAAVSLGRMQAKDRLELLRQYWDKKPTLDQFSNACGWAIERLTGEKMPEPEVLRSVRRDWFLIPIVE